MCLITLSLSLIVGCALCLVVVYSTVDCLAFSLIAFCLYCGLYCFGWCTRILVVVCILFACWCAFSLLIWYSLSVLVVRILFGLASVWCVLSL
jgi:hypothetical protein